MLRRSQARQGPTESVVTDCLI